MTWALIAQALVIALLVIDRHIRESDAAKERARLMNAAIARHAGDFIALQRTTTTDPADAAVEPTRSPLVGLE